MPGLSRLQPRHRIHSRPQFLPFSGNDCLPAKRGRCAQRCTHLGGTQFA